MAREVPNVPTGLDPQTRNFFSAIREAVNQFTLNGGSSADSLNSNLTADNLTGIANSLDNLLSTTIPPIPTGVTATGIFSTVMVTWNRPYYDYFSFAEIWRANAVDSAGLLIPPTGTNANGHSINFVTDATLVGTSNGEIYTDSVTPGTKYYYWVRFLSSANIAGPYNASIGIIGSTVQTIDALMLANGWTLETNALLDGLITANKIADFAVTNAKIGNTAITNAKIANLAVSTAQIQDLAVTSAKINSLAVEKLYATTAWIATADILDGSITNAKIGNTIQSDNYNGSTLGWQLSKTGGTVNLNQLTIRDAAGNIILSSGTGIPWAGINGTGKPGDNATRNVFQGNWATATAYIIGDIVLDTLGYGWSCVQVHTSSGSLVTPIYPVTSNTYWTLYAVKGVDAISAILSNDTHVFPATALGVPTYTGSGTTINVYDGTREVIYDGLGTSIGTWNVTGVGTNVAVSTKVDSGNYVTYPDMSSGVDSNIDASKIVYTITGKSYNGTAFTITAQQSFAKSKAGATGSASASAAAFAISNSGSIFVKDASGTVLPSAGIAITTYSQNISSQTYQWYKNGTSISGATSGSYTIPTTDYASLNTNTYKCIITGTVASVSGQTLEDSITVPLIIDGSSSPAVIVSNETSNFPAQTIGYSGIIFTGGNCDITAYIGTTRLAYNTTGANTFSCTNASVSNCTVATGTGTSYTYSVIAPTAMTSDTGYNDVIITIRDGAGTALSTITKRINYSLSRAGVNAAYVILTSEQAFKFVAGSATPTVTTIVLNASLFGGLTTYEWDYWNGTAWAILSGTATSSTYSLAYNNAAFTGNSLRVRCLSGTSYDETTLVKLYDGATGINAINGFLTNEACTVPALSDGTGAAYTSAGGTFKVFSGTTDVTTSCTFSTSAAVSGLTLAIGAATGIYSLSGTWTSDTAAFTLTAVYSGTTLTKTYTLTKAKAGINGSNGSSTYTATIYRQISTITAPSGGTYNFSTGVLTAPAGWTITAPTVSTTPTWSCDYNFTSTTPATTLTATTWTNLHINMVKGADGINGTRTAILDLYIWGSTTPTVFPSGTSSYTWATGQFTNPATLNSWSQTPPSATAGQSLYVCHAIFADSLATTTSTVTWSATVANLTGAAGANGETGSTGAAGQRIGFLELYIWSAAAPTVYPSGSSTYTWTTGIFTAPATLNGWALVPATAVAGQSLWGISATISNATTTATDTVTWSSTSPYVVGYAGGNGTSIHIIELYSTTATPLPSATTYNFSTDTLTGTLGSWSRVLPASSTTPTYVTTCTFTVIAPTVSQTNSTWTTAVVKSKNGVDGAQGLTGSAGTNGTNGTNGASLFTWLKYADTTTTGMSDLPDGKTYMGIAYNKTVAAESVVYTDYDWSLIKGTDGINGVAGTTTYTWVKYATTVTGTGINDSPMGMTYIGLAFNKTTATESVVTTDYAWSLIQGANGATGAQGPSVVVTSNIQASFTATDGTLDATQADIIFTAATSGVTSPTYVWTFSGFQTAPTNSGVATQTITTAQFGISKSAIVTCTVSGTYVDKITVVRLERTTAAAGATVGATFGSNIYGQITPANVSTYIADLTVNTLQISGNAVTVPYSFTGGSVNVYYNNVAVTVISGTINCSGTNNVLVNFFTNQVNSIAIYSTAALSAGTSPLNYVLYVDGVEQFRTYWVWGSTTLSRTLTLSAGSHIIRYDAYSAIGSAGLTVSTTTNIPFSTLNTLEVRR